MDAIGKGLMAGFVATFVLSILMMIKQFMGVMPELDPISMLGAMAGFEAPAAPLFGWIGHFMIGTVFWGIGFAVLNDWLPGPQWLRGVMFAGAAWLMMMVVVMPMAGKGLFGLGLGIMVPVATLMLHVVFGVVLGNVYGALNRHYGLSRTYAR